MTEETTRGRELEVLQLYPPKNTDLNPVLHPPCHFWEVRLECSTFLNLSHMAHLWGPDRLLLRIQPQNESKSHHCEQEPSLPAPGSGLTEFSEVCHTLVVLKGQRLGSCMRCSHNTELYREDHFHWWDQMISAIGFYSETMNHRAS